MIKIIFVCALIAFVTGDVSVPRLDGRIVGGRNVTIEEYPYNIVIHGGNRCGGIILSSKYILTAAHCTNGRDVARMTIRAGSTKHSYEGQVVKVKNFVVHPLYVRATLDYDISILELESELEFSNAIQPVTLPDLNEEYAPGTPCTATGWGAISESGGMASTLLAVDVKVFAQETCKSSYKGSITPRMFCAGVDGGGKDSCGGDSGGPLVAGKKLIGIVSWGSGCARPGKPGVYANVAVLRDYINENTGL